MILYRKCIHLEECVYETTTCVSQAHDLHISRLPARFEREADRTLPSKRVLCSFGGNPRDLNRARALQPGSAASFPFDFQAWPSWRTGLAESDTSYSKKPRDRCRLDVLSSPKDTREILCFPAVCTGIYQVYLLMVLRSRVFELSCNGRGHVCLRWCRDQPIAPRDPVSAARGRLRRFSFDTRSTRTLSWSTVCDYEFHRAMIFLRPGAHFSAASILGQPLTIFDGTTKTRCGNGALRMSNFRMVADGLQFSAAPQVVKHMLHMTARVSQCPDRRTFQSIRC